MYWDLYFCIKRKIYRCKHNILDWLLNNYREHNDFLDMNYMYNSNQRTWYINILCVNYLCYLEIFHFLFSYFALILTDYLFLFLFYILSLLLSLFIFFVVVNIRFKEIFVLDRPNLWVNNIFLAFFIFSSLLPLCNNGNRNTEVKKNILINSQNQFINSKPNNICILV